MQGYSNPGAGSNPLLNPQVCKTPCLCKHCCWVKQPCCICCSPAEPRAWLHSQPLLLVCGNAYMFLCR